MRTALLLALGLSGAIPPASAQPMRPTGEVTFTPVPDPSGIYPALRADVEMEVLEPGRHGCRTWLMQDSVFVSQRPAWRTNLKTRIQIDADSAGRYTSRLHFSGEHIFGTGRDGPLTLYVRCGSPGDWTFQTPPYEHERFGEILVRMANPAVRPVDDDGDGLYESMEATADVFARGTTGFVLKGSVEAPDRHRLGRSAHIAARLAGGEQATLTLRFPSTPIRRYGQDGRYRARLTLDAVNDYYQHEEVESAPLAAADFEAVLEAVGTATETPLDANGDGLYETLRITVPVTLTGDATYSVIGQLTAAADTSRSPASVHAKIEGVTRADTTVVLDFVGRGIAREQIDGPYRLELSIYEDNRFIDDAVVPGLSSTYQHTAFEPARR